MDAREYAADVCFDLGVGETQDEQIRRGECGVARAIVFRLLVVNGAVKLDDEAGGVAVEVHDEAIYDLLAALAQTIG